jgi:hypothetical protein
MLSARSNSASERIGRNGNARIRSRYFWETLATALSSLPFSQIVLFVGQNMPYIAFLAIVVNGNNKAILVAADIKYNKFAGLICASKKLPHIRKASPG